MSYLRGATTASALALAFTLSACGGGGSPAAVVAPAVSSAKPSKTTVQGSARSTATITIPARGTASVRHTSWVSPSTLTLIIQTSQALPGPGNASIGTYDLFDVSSSSTLCTTGSSGRTCTVPFAALPGTDQVMIQASDSKDATTGDIIGLYNKTGVVFSATADNSMSFVLGGVIGTQFGLATPAPLTAASGPADISVPLTLEDGAANVITGLLDAPLCVLLQDTNSPTAGQFAISGAAATAPTCTMPSAVGSNVSSGIPQGTGVAISDLGQLSTLTVHYLGTGADTAKLTVATTSPQSYLNLDQYRYAPIYQTLTLTAQ